MFTVEQQKDNRLVLANLLENNITDDEYDHHVFMKDDLSKGCALGHAAKFGIGGMYLEDGDIPMHKGVPNFPNFAFADGSYTFVSSTMKAAEIVFGNNTYFSLFADNLDYDRSTVVQSLRAF